MYKNNPCVGLIPARLESQRLPGKPLELIAGIPMVVHVAVRAKMSELLDSVIVCTDSKKIVEICDWYRIQTCLTGSHHVTGTDRIGEAARALEINPGSVIVDIQGDEPLIDPMTIDDLIKEFIDSDFEIMLPYLEFNDHKNINTVKIVESNGRILFMSREDIPSMSFTVTALKKHLSIVAFRSDSLDRFCSYPPSTLEKIENIELLRAIENDISIGTFPVFRESLAVDVRTDLEKVNQLMPEDEIYKKYQKIKNLLGSSF